MKIVRVKFDKLLHNTGKAILVRIGNKEIWLGHFMIRSLVVNKKYGGHFRISTKFCDEKGIDYEESDVVFKIERHIPEPKDKSIIKHDKSLER